MDVNPNPRDFSKAYKFLKAFLKSVSSRESIVSFQGSPPFL
jgi:hypothetical protein